jgi:hypothetical protein
LWRHAAWQEVCLEEAGLPVPKTHDLDDLLNGLLALEPLWAAFRPALQNLTDYAVDFRYPGQSASTTKHVLGPRQTRYASSLVSFGVAAGTLFDVVVDDDVQLLPRQPAVPAEHWGVRAAAQPILSR